MIEVKTIYGLLDPRNEEIFYVGESKRLMHRAYTHIGLAWTNVVDRIRGNHRNLAKDERIRSIMGDGMLPVIVVLDWNDRSSEKYWIDLLKGEGQPLTNQRSGVSRHSEATKALMSKSQKRRWENV